MKTVEGRINNEKAKRMLITTTIAGAGAGTCVDIVFFPLDTMKTRLQSQYGFFKSGGFKGLYKGVFPVLIGSAPTSALFFITYDTMKAFIEPKITKEYHAFLHMSAASLGEMIACLVRVPVEVIKQRKQVLLTDRIKLSMLYQGYWSTVLRDIPFSLIQFPLWEIAKKFWSNYTNRDVLPLESATCGGIAGAISAACTTPLDVAKTRIMLSKKSCPTTELKISYVLRNVYRTNGISGLFAGVGPRVIWIFLGGHVFFGTYEFLKVITEKRFPPLLL